MLQSSTAPQPVGALSLMALQLHPLLVSSSFRPIVLLPSLTVLEGPFPWSGCMNQHWESQNQRVLIFKPSLPELLSIQWAGKTLVPNFFKNQQKQDPEKRPSLGEEELSCSLKLPSLQLVDGAVPRRRAPRGCPAVASRAPGVSGRVQGAGSSCYSMGPWYQGLICVPI